MQARFFPLALEEDRNKQINDLCDAINDATRSKPSHFDLYSICNEHGWYSTINKIAAAKPYATKGSKVALLVGESNLLSLLPEIGLHADVILCNDINSDLNRYTQFLVQCLAQSSTRKEFEEYYKKQENGQYCNPLAYNINEEWKKLADNWINEKHFLSSDARFALCKEQLSKLKIVWHNANLFNTFDCLELSKILKKYQAVITLINVNNLHMYPRWYKEDIAPLRALLNDSPSPIILYSVGMESYTDGRALRSRISFGTEDYFSLLDERENFMHWEKAWSDWSDYDGVDEYKVIVSDNLTKMANIFLKKLAIENGINLTYIPSISFDKSIGFNFNAMDLPSDSIPENIRPKLVLILKGLLEWEKKNWFEEEDFFKEAQIKLNNKQNNTYCLSLEDKKIYYKSKGESRECKIVDPSSFNNLIHEIENNEQFKKIKNGRNTKIINNKLMRIRRGDTPELMWFIQNKAPELKELFIKCIGRSRFELTQFDERIDLFSLANFVKQHLQVLNTNTVESDKKVENDSESYEQIKECFRCVFESNKESQKELPFVFEYNDELEEDCPRSYPGI
ncbi:Uncharacterised protein [Legionella sainthelensi]|uniref:hypothetical protein n=1 Tax=Legionella sainthelensi TaxID=28087 RepID=UPI000F6CC9AE|nr:hypothetical protein [Legionella sainthelensi]VEB35400.1 Uncharacterised protein [Legionella sainthelensi]